jgi:oxalate decarboxylase
MDPFSRKILAFSTAEAVATAASVAQAASFGTPDALAHGAVNASLSAVRDLGPQNPGLAAQFPNAVNSSAADVRDLPEFWVSFINAYGRIPGGE